MSGFKPEQIELLKKIIANRNTDSLESKLKNWAEAPSQSEHEKCERAVRMIKNAVGADEILSKLDVSVFGKGSFFNRTNIRSDSDVDVGVRLNSVFFNEYPDGKGDADFDEGYSTATYRLSDFKRDLTNAIINYFGSEGVTVGNKAILVHENTVRVDADVVAKGVYQRFWNDGTRWTGVFMRTADGTKIVNFPDQDYDNGVSKNSRTRQKYKAAVRIVKNLRCDMGEAGYNSAKFGASYLIACLVYNVPDRFFAEENLTKMMEDILEQISLSTSEYRSVLEWVEVNERKYLFREQQAWKLDEVHLFITEAFTFLKSLHS